MQWVACGSGGMFVQSARFVAEHQKNPAAELTICGVEKTDETGRLGRLNLAVHGLEGDIKHGGNINSYYDDPHTATGQFDFVLANPPFNVNAVDKERLAGMVGAGRRFPFGFPLIDNVAAADVTKAHIQEIVDTIKSRATPTQNMVRTAKKTLADMRQMFGFALDHDYVDADPTARVKKARIGADVERDRVLSEAELILLFQKLPKASLAITSQMALLIQLATAARIGEVLAARWEHVDFERRMLTLPETKNGKWHEIWLSDFALCQLKTLHENTGLTAWLFPATQTKKDQSDFADHVCIKTVTKQVGDRQRPGDLPMTGRSKDVDALVLPGGKWTPHDLRRTAATTMAELGGLPDVVEKCLNHTEVGKVKRIYQRAQYEGPMRDA